MYTHYIYIYIHIHIHIHIHAHLLYRYMHNVVQSSFGVQGPPGPAPHPAALRARAETACRRYSV